MQADATLRALKSQINDKDDFRKAYARQESSYWQAEACLAELQGHKLDAMAYYESALLARLDSGSVPAAGEKDDLAHDAHQLWASLGGSDGSWKLWYVRRADAMVAQSHLTWESVQDPLPPFQLADLHGKTWQLDDLKGKIVFLNFWASY
jgi:thioesterase domain-containing protein